MQISSKAIKIIGYAATALGALTTIVSSKVEERKTHDTIVEEVAKALAEQKK